MKYLISVITLAALMAGAAYAHPTAQFAKDKGLEGATDSWNLARNGTSWQLSFTTGSTVVTETISPEPGPVGDFVTMSTTTVTDLVDHGECYATNLVPDGDLTIGSGGTEVLRADLDPGAAIVGAMNWLAYDSPDDDLDVIDHEAGHSMVLHTMAVADGQDEYSLDLNIVGTSGHNLYETLKDTGATASGDLAGTIHAVAPTAIPPPGTLLLSGIGTVLIGWIRGRRWL